MNKTLTEEFRVQEVSDTIVPENKSMAAFTLLLFVLSAAVGGCLVLYNGPQIRLIQLCSFLVLGCLFAAVVEKKQSASDNNNGFLYTFLLTACIHVGVGLISFFLNRFDLFFNLSFAAAFFLPSVVVEAWKVYRTIPKIGPSVWNYANTPPAAPAFPISKIPVRIAVKKSYMKPRVLFTDVAPETVLSTALYISVKEQYDKLNATAIFVNEEGKTYNWVFYKSHLFFWKRYLHPNATLYENGIKPNILITAERLSFESE